MSSLICCLENILKKDSCKRGHPPVGYRGVSPSTIAILACPVFVPRKHIFLADTRHHIGTADPKKINLIKIGYKKDMLI